MAGRPLTTVSGKPRGLLVHEMLEPNGTPGPKGPNGSSQPVGAQEANNVYGRVLQTMDRKGLDTPVIDPGEHDLANLADALDNGRVVAPITPRPGVKGKPGQYKLMPIRERQSKVFELRRLGHSVTAIASLFGVNRHIISKDLTAEAQRRYAELGLEDKHALTALSVARYDDVIQIERARMTTPQATGHEGKVIIAAQQAIEKVTGLDPELIAKEERERLMRPSGEDIFDRINPANVTEIYGFLVKTVGGQGRGEPLQISPGNDASKAGEPSSGE